MYGEDDLDVFFSDDGVPCVKVGFDPFLCLHWRAGRVMEIGGEYQMVQGDGAITVKTSDVAAFSLAADDQVTVAGIAYLLSPPMLLDDGALSLIALTRA